MDATWSNHVAGALAECVRSGQHQILVDMGGVDYISSAGIRVLVLYARQLGNIQGRLSVINASSSVRKVLEMTGLSGRLFVQAGATSPATCPAEELVRRISLPAGGATAEVYELTPLAGLRVAWPGDSIAWFEGRSPLETCVVVPFPGDVIGIGLGALVSGDASFTQPLGEFLAAAGAAVCQPADGANKPDYLLLEGALTPAIKVAYGMVGCGGFSRLMRFDKGPQQSSVGFSALVNSCLDASGSDAIGLAVVAETDYLIGASLQKLVSPQQVADRTHDIFSFPEIRDWLSFTAEPAFGNSTCLLVGFATRNTHGPGVPLLKPITPSGDLRGHFHAAAFPYHPLRKGKVELAETIQPLFETGQLLGVLHLLNDWREVSGAGESRFLRGACWCAPVNL